MSEPRPAPTVTDPVELLTTTRSVRRRLDLSRPVPRELIEACLEMAIQAPSGSNLQGWRFLVIDDPDRKAALGRYYARSYENYVPSSATNEQLRQSVDFLATRLVDVPVVIVPLERGRLPAEATSHQAASFYGSIFPAVWSFMLAARLYAVGTTFTTMHLRFEREVAAEFGIPFERYTQVGLIAAGYYTGDRFSPAKRRPVSELTHWNTWPAP